MLRRIVMKLSTFIVFAYFCTLLIVKIIKESMILVKTFGTTTILIRGYEAVTIVSIVGIIAIALLITRVSDWIFFDKEEVKFNEEIEEKQVEA